MVARDESYFPILREERFLNPRNHQHHWVDRVMLTRIFVSKTGGGISNHLVLGVPKLAVEM